MKIGGSGILLCRVWSTILVYLGLCCKPDEGAMCDQGDPAGSVAKFG